MLSSFGTVFNNLALVVKY